MSFAGFKKQLNKANQFMSEKIGGAKGSQLEEDFIELERKTDATAKLVDSLQDKTKEYLQPNPAARAKLSMQSTVQKVRGEARVSKYPQTEGILGETLNKGGMEIGEDSLFGQALIEAGEAFKQCAEIKDALDTSVKQNFLDPLHQLQERDIKEIMAHRKKLSGRRLDYDCKKRKAHKVTEEEIRIAEEKFEESKELCYSSMLNLIESDVEQISQLAYLSEAILDFHTHCGEVMRSLVSTLNDRVSEASSRPRTERQRSSFRSSFKATNDGDTDSVDSSKGSYAFGSTPTPTPSDPTPSATTPSAPPAAEVPPSTGGELYKAMYDFEKENEGELGFNEGDIITVTDRIDENWLEGTLNGRKGLFPANYVEKM